MNQMYEQKYLKYKAKYLELKNQMRGGVICKSCGRSYNPVAGEKCICKTSEVEKVKKPKLIPAEATFIDNTNLEKINIFINNKSIVLSVGDCLKFNRFVGYDVEGEEGEAASTIGKIIGFGSNGKYANRIFLERLEPKSNLLIIQNDIIGLEYPYLESIKSHWSNIVKLEKCP